MPVHAVFFTADKPRKLRFRHLDLKDVVATTNKSMTDLLNDPFFGWAHLLAFGLRFEDPKITVNRASELIDVYLEKSEPDGTLHKLEDIGIKLTEALEASGYIRIHRLEDGDEGNATTPATVAT